MDFDHPPKDPVAVIREWLADADKLGLDNPNAMALSTVGSDGMPSNRMVLLKSLDENGAVFYANRNSRKGKSLAVHPNASLLFHWDALHRQIAIEGEVSVVSDQESDQYFSTRARESQLGAWASQQSQPARDRAQLDLSLKEIEKRFEGKEVPRPSHWGGYRVGLHRIEFWEGRDHRLHDRVVYTPDGKGGWLTQRLYP